MHYFIDDPLVLQRIAEPIDVSRKIKQYGENNLYPQIVHNMMLRSPLTKSAVLLLTDFVNGDGFENESETLINSLGQTLDDALRKSASDLSEYRGFAAHLNFNIGGQVVEITPIPFEFVRLGLPDDRGIISDVKISNNWESSNMNLLDDDPDANIQTFPIWKPLDFTPTATGAVFYFSDLGFGRYPLCSFDPILDNAQSDAEIQVFEVNNLTNGFHSGTIFKHVGPFENDRAEDRFKEKINMMLGSRGGNSTMLVTVDEAIAEIPLVEGLPANNNDTLFTQTTKNVRNRVQQFFNLPSGIFGVAAEGAVFQASELGESFVYMNIRTKNDRRILERFFNRFLNAGEIITNSFESDQMLDQEPPEETPPPPPEETPPTPDE